MNLFFTAYRLSVFILALLCTSCAQANSCQEPDLDCILAKYDTDPHGDLRSVVVIRDGVWLAERYYGDADKNTLVDIRSAGKSITSLLMGMAIDAGAVASLDDPVSKYWPETEGSAIGPVKLSDVMTMRTGLDADSDNPNSPGYEDFMDESDDPLSWALTVPNSDPPGTIYRYNSLAAYVAGVVVSRAANKSMKSFARNSLFEPLGITRWDWQEDNSGITKGQGNLFLTAPGFARIGEMVWRGGEYGGQRLVSEHWIRDSLAQHVDISASTSNAAGYGYYWYHTSYDVAGRRVDVSFASGNGGNKIYIVPAFDLVVTVMSTAYGEGRGHRRSEAILKAILALQQTH